MNYIIPVIKGHFWSRPKMPWESWSLGEDASKRNPKANRFGKNVIMVILVMMVMFLGFSLPSREGWHWHL